MVVVREADHHAQVATDMSRIRVRTGVPTTMNPPQAEGVRVVPDVSKEKPRIPSTVTNWPQRQRVVEKEG